MKDVFNGKKVVKWFLRLLPILILLYVMICAIAIFRNYNGEIDYINFGDIVSGMIESFMDSYGLPIFDMLGIGNRITIFFNNYLNIISGNMFTDFVISTLVYELYLSFLFLIFDVFNYMFTIANRFFEKGRNLNE